MNKVARKVSLYKLAKHLDDAGRVFGDPAVILSKNGRTASIKFNRPRFFNCIDESVITPTAAFLSNIVTDQGTDMLVIEGSNHKNKNHAFTTGGDLLMGWNIIDRKEKTDTISEQERLYLVNIYRTQHYLHKLGKAKNVISFMDGVSMGSGVLFGLNSTFSVATERTVWSIPEVSIGGMPDVGVIFHMNKMSHKFGTMLALTGQRLFGTDVVHSGIATHFCKSKKVDDLKHEIKRLEGNSAKREEIKEVLDVYHYESIDKEEEKTKQEKILRIQDFTKKVYSSDNILDIIDNLKMLEDDWSKQQLKLLSNGCPLSLRVTQRFLQEQNSADKCFDSCLLDSYKAAGNIYFCGEMKIGIENAMVYRGKQKPRWSMPRVEDVPDSLVDYVFDNEFAENVLTMKQLRDIDTTMPY